MDINTSVEKDIFKLILEYTSPNKPKKFTLENLDTISREPLTLIGDKFYYIVNNKIYVDHMRAGCSSNSDNPYFIEDCNKNTIYYPKLNDQIVWDTCMAFNKYLYRNIGSICILITKHYKLFSVLNNSNFYMDHSVNCEYFQIAKNRHHNSNVWYLDKKDGYFYLNNDKSTKYTNKDIIKIYNF